MRKLKRSLKPKNLDSAQIQNWLDYSSRSILQQKVILPQNLLSAYHDTLSKHETEG